MVFRDKMKDGTIRLTGAVPGGGSGLTRVGCQIYRSAAWVAATTGTNITAQVPYDALDYEDIGSMWDAGAPSQIVIPATGFWDVQACITWEGGISGYTELQLRRNGTMLFGWRGDAAGSFATINAARTRKLNAGDIITAFYEKRSGNGAVTEGVPYTFMSVIGFV